MNPYPDPEGRVCDDCGHTLIIDCAGLACDYCWRIADAEFGGEGDDQ